MFKEGTILKISYTGKVKTTGDVFETTDEKTAKDAGIHNPNNRYQPAVIVVGKHNVLPGLDNEILKMSVGDKKTIELSAKDAFGERDVDKIIVTPLQEFKKRDMMPFPGMVIEADGQHARVLSVSGGRVRLDLNHELAGKDVIYDIKVEEEVKEKKAQAIAFIEKRFPNAEISEQKVKVNGTTIEVELSEDQALDKNVVLRKRFYCEDVFLYIDGIEKVRFSEEIHNLKKSTKDEEKGE
ncbi:MAG: FKBP-type peptidyl-prolyl cis-trans isomerase [Candidatus Diapherotrites archaeon]|nr:FKBP-type peptidyl-prolyl cis-trans isomerase [Candidatus Diapherotrites archaeon]